MEKVILYALLCCCGVGALLTCILVPMHFSYVNREHIGLKRDGISKEVDVSESYGRGRYGWGVSKKALQFDSLFQLMTFRKPKGSKVDGLESASLIVFSDAGEITLDIAFYFRLTKPLLGDLYENFGQNYIKNLVEQATDSLRGSAGDYKVQDYQSNRSIIEDKFFTDLQQKLQSTGFVQVQRKHFFLEDIQLPQTTLNKRIESFKNEELTFQQAANLQSNQERLRTQEIVKNVTNQRTLELETATANAKRMRANANAAAFAKTQSEVGVRLKTMISTLGVSGNTTQQLIQYNSMLDVKDKKYTVLSGLSGSRFL